MMNTIGSWQKKLAVFGVLLGIVTWAPTATAQNATIKRPIEDFLKTQGKFSVTIIPPEPDFVGFYSDVNKPPQLFAGVDYAGLTNTYSNTQPQFSGSVTERSLSGARREVTVLLQSKGVNFWVVKTTPGVPDGNVTINPVLFGHRPADVRAGAAQVLGNSFLHVVFIDNKRLGDPLPDLYQVTFFKEAGQELKFFAFQAQAEGPLTAAFGVPEGTKGRVTITQTGLFMTNGRGAVGNGGRGIADLFPVENIKLQVVGH